jgi:hypothetical protein
MLRAQIGFMHRLAFVSQVIFRSALMQRNVFLQRARHSIIHSSLCAATTRSLGSTQQQTIKATGIHNTC